ncbi:hypothetical protein DFH28DRAFT_1157380 [Melampsora americana]|nr:hypothetical protein DFH28DRAFT_1157380 [Melampsora americana]
MSYIDIESEYLVYAMCKARGKPHDINNGNSKCIRRPALELGQNGNQVKIVVIMGAMDPSISYRMGGKAGPDGHSDLVIHSFHTKMPTSPNAASEIVTTSMTN